jgi:hypothetical protein
MKYEIASHVHYQILDGEVIILDSRGDTYLGLNKSGAVIWETIAQGGSAEDAAQRLVDRFGIPPEKSTADVGKLLSELVGSGLLRETK